MTQIELVQQALRKEASVEEIGALLRQLPPNKDAADLLIATYQSSLAEPWKVAFLLGCVRHEVGYETVKAILVGNYRGSSELSAAEAMYRIHDVRAIEDLQNILLTHPHILVRNAAANALSLARSPTVVLVLIEAFRQGKLWPHDVAQQIADSQPTDKQLLELLDSNDERQQSLGLHVIALLIQAGGQASWRTDAVRGQVIRLLHTPLFRPKWKQMPVLTNWAFSRG
ncbi:hypothetical protein DTL21_28930 [Bremerella cremea]|uniref:HEAT repeat domain-containing protein n=1 Tax=Blastopirellula marina TaxID=124 RepID=A0A2S8F8Z1_9BACT|nr:MULTISPECIES: hypothetical protein [Pirellulaceae]PQO28617.1 hypothetical protein C5Y83_28880 [Blastopirellula marina]RCS41988.1 hypothetical protein DTL21_28930 [Bremerella cremea]